jgi:RimJ/RimL family protein N-acetyltransferase
MPITMIANPSIDTARLSMRVHAVSDYEDEIAMWGDPTVTRYIGGRASTREETWSRLLRYAGHWPLMGYGYWAVRERATGRFVGDVGFADFRRDIEPSLDNAPEMGWVLAPWSHGRGFATEATRAALDWLEEHAPVPRTVCMIDAPNAPSIRVAAKCGFAPWTRTTYKGSEVTVYERLRTPRTSVLTGPPSPA